MSHMVNFSIAEAAKACDGKLVLQNETNEAVCLTSLVIDSRKVTCGGAFLAVPGERVDGHRFISNVYKQGAVLAITAKTPEQVEKETGTDCSDWGSYLLVEDTLAALRKIAEAYRIKAGIPIVGITGSVGKTSTKEFIAAVLEEKYKVLKTEGNFNNEIGVPLTLLRIEPEHEIAVVEMGISDFGEMHRLSKMVRPNVCVITNIGQCHLENLKTRDGILQAKSEIFDFMAEDGVVCLNGEDDKLSTLACVQGRTPHFFGLGGSPLEEVQALDVESRGLWGSDAKLVIDGSAVEIHVPLPGRHMVLNAAAAACVAVQMGLEIDEIAAGIGKVEPVSGRNHLIRLDRYTLIDDCYNANPASMKAAIDLLEMADTVKVAILGDMFELGENTDALHAEVGLYAADAGLDILLCVGENSKHMYDAATEKVRQTENSVSPMRVIYFDDLQTLLQGLQEKKDTYIPEGCTVLIKASHGMNFAKVLEVLKE